MKKIFACILLLTIITAMFGCGSENKNGGDKKVTENYGTGHKIYIREGYSDKITATFFLHLLQMVGFIDCSSIRG